MLRAESAECNILRRPCITVVSTLASLPLHFHSLTPNIGRYHAVVQACSARFSTEPVSTSRSPNPLPGSPSLPGRASLSCDPMVLFHYDLAQLLSS